MRIDTAMAQLIVDPPASGAWNMAVDEALLAAAADEGVVTLRFYQWKEPTLSLGYFQRYEDRELHPASRACAVVRRPSGGGAILHDRELTYSLTVPASHPWAKDAPRLYREVHQALIEVVGQFGIEARLYDQASFLPAAREPFLCFLRRAEGDVVVDCPADATTGSTVKIVGSAQRRRRGAILQHGSFLLTRSPAAPELPGLAEVARDASRLPDIPSWIELWQAELGRGLDVSWHAAALSPAVERAARRLAAQKYADESWTRRR